MNDIAATPGQNKTPTDVEWVEPADKHGVRWDGFLMSAKPDPKSRRRMAKCTHCDQVFVNGKPETLFKHMRSGCKQVPIDVRNAYLSAALEAATNKTKDQKQQKQPQQQQQQNSPFEREQQRSPTSPSESSPFQKNTALASSTSSTAKKRKIDVDNLDPMVTSSSPLLSHAHPHVSLPPPLPPSLSNHAVSPHDAHLHAHIPSTILNPDIVIAIQNLVRQEFSMVRQELLHDVQEMFIIQEKKETARFINSSLMEDHSVLAPLPTRNGCPPTNFPRTVRDFWELNHHNIEQLLQEYGLSTFGPPERRIRRLATFCRIRSPVERILE